MTDHVKNVCKIGQGSLCCRYLVMGTEGFECGRMSGMEEVIDNRIHSMTAKGNNCGGKTIKELNKPQP